jgi:hypothetical protein
MKSQKQNFRNILIAVILTLCNLVFAIPFISFAQSDQDVSLSISPDYNWANPSELTLPRTFMNKNADTYIYQPYNPANINEYIRVNDLRNNGGFTVTLAISDFKETVDCPPLVIGPCFGVNTIPYTNVGIVTLANVSQPSSVDTPGPTNAQNHPAGTDGDTVYSTLDCDWNSNTDFQTTCDSVFQNFTGIGLVSDSQTIMDGTSPTNIGRVGQYWLALGIRLRIPQGTTPGNYQSTFTFSLTPEAFP